MKKTLFILICLTASLLATAFANEPIKLQSPDKQLELSFELRDGVPYYALNRAGKPVVLPSKMGFILEWRDDLKDHFVLKETKYSTFDETWEPVWGEEAKIRNHYNELLVTLEQPVGSVASMDHSTETRATIMQVRFRLYDDGLGFRYEFPIPNALACFWFKEELTEFAMAGNHKAWWIPGDYDTQEYNYTESRLSEIPALWEASHEGGGWPWTPFSKTGVQTALQMKTDDGLYLNIHEAATVDFPTMHLDLIVDSLNPSNYTFRSWLCPDAAGYKGRLNTPCHTPWRTVMVCTSATEVLASRLILNLNEPCAIEDVSWIHPVMEGNTLRITVDSNAGGHIRRGVVACACGDYRDTLRIGQYDMQNDVIGSYYLMGYYGGNGGTATATRFDILLRNDSLFMHWPQEHYADAYVHLPFDRPSCTLFIPSGFTLYEDERSIVNGFFYDTNGRVATAAGAGVNAQLYYSESTGYNTARPVMANWPGHELSGFILRNTSIVSTTLLQLASPVLLRVGPAGTTLDN